MEDLSVKEMMDFVTKVNENPNPSKKDIMQIAVYSQFLSMTSDEMNTVYMKLSKGNVKESFGNMSSNGVMNTRMSLALLVLIVLGSVYFFKRK